MRLHQPQAPHGQVRIVAYREIALLCSLDMTTPQVDVDDLIPCPCRDRQQQDDN